MSRITILTELRGKDVEIELSVSPPSILGGIMGYSFGAETITDSQGNLLDWELTDDETEHVCNKIEEYMGGNWSEEDYDYMKDDDDTQRV